MRVLLVEDDENKRSQMIRLLREDLAIDDVQIAASYIGGVDRVLKERFDLVVLDMTLPTYEVNADDEGGRPRAFGGRDILLQMKRRGLATPVIVVTQFDKFGDRGESKTRAELDIELAKAHPIIYRGMVYYNSALEGWKDDLARAIEKAKRVGGE
jgi:CheY-like chemotaxis protein